MSKSLKYLFAQSHSLIVDSQLYPSFPIIQKIIQDILTSNNTHNNLKIIHSILFQDDPSKNNLNSSPSSSSSSSTTPSSGKTYHEDMVEIHDFRLNLVEQPDSIFTSILNKILSTGSIGNDNKNYNNGIIEKVSSSNNTITRWIFIDSIAPLFIYHSVPTVLRMLKEFTDKLLNNNIKLITIFHADTILPPFPFSLEETLLKLFPMILYLGKSSIVSSYPSSESSHVTDSSNSDTIVKRNVLHGSFPALAIYQKSALKIMKQDFILKYNVQSTENGRIQVIETVHPEDTFSNSRVLKKNEKSSSGKDNKKLDVDQLTLKQKESKETTILPFMEAQEVEIHSKKIIAATFGDDDDLSEEEDPDADLDI